MRTFKIEIVKRQRVVIETVPPNKKALELMRHKLDEVDKGLKLLRQFYGNPKFNV